MRAFVHTASGFTALFSGVAGGARPDSGRRGERLQAGMSVDVFPFRLFFPEKGLCCFFKQGVVPDAVSGERPGRNLWAARLMAKGRKAGQSVS